MAKTAAWIVTILGALITIGVLIWMAVSWSKQGSSFKPHWLWLGIGIAILLVGLLLFWLLPDTKVAVVEKKTA